MAAYHFFYMPEISFVGKKYDEYLRKYSGLLNYPNNMLFVGRDPNIGKPCFTLAKTLQNIYLHMCWRLSQL